MQTLYGGANWIIFQALTPACTADRFSHLAKQMIEFAPGKSIFRNDFCMYKSYNVTVSTGVRAWKRPCAGLVILGRSHLSVHRTKDQNWG